MEEIKARAFEARDSYKAGLITRLEAKEMIMPYIKLYNKARLEKRQRASV